MATEQATVRAPAADAGFFSTFRSLGSFFKRNLTKRVGSAVVFWGVETRLATPMAVFFVASLGRWNGALAMGAVMATYSAIFLFLFEGERVIEEMRSGLRQKPWGQRALHIAERADRAGTVQRLAVAPFTIMFMGPFWRAVAYRIARVRNVPAYVLSVGGSFPHSLFWTGVVLGTVFELLLEPVWDVVRDGVWAGVTGVVGVVA